jgi:hypothetical protein
MKFLVIAFFSLLTGCTSLDLHRFFSNKIDCGNGWYAINERICELERYGY